jgi:pumilio homology domain family member 6
MELRWEIAQELKGHYCELAESKYAKFLVARLIVEGNQKTKDLVIQEFYGHIRKLINHPEASWIVDDIYRQVAKPDQKTIMLREWYGPEFNLFKGQDQKEASAELSKILEQMPEKRKPIMDHLRGMIDQLIQKKKTAFTMLHDAMLQYYLNVAPGSTDANEFLMLLIGDKEEQDVDLLRNLAFTKSGSRVLCLALAYGTPKERRQLLRAFKETIEMMAQDKNGHLVLLTALEVIDDTRETSSRIFSELVNLTKTAMPESQHEKILALVDHPQGRVVLLYPFAGPLTPSLSQAAHERISEVRKIRETTSKKNPETRQRELVQSLLPPVQSAIEVHAATLSQSPSGCALISKALLVGSEIETTALDVVALLAAGDPSEEGHISHSVAGVKMLKALVAGGPYNKEEKRVVLIDPPLNFHNKLYSQIKEHVVKWACGPGSMVVVALLEAEGFESESELKTTLKAAREELEKVAKGEGAVDVVVEEGTKKKKGRKKQANLEPKGNTGAKILLEKLDG